MFAFTDVNMSAVLVATVAGFLLGVFWYLPNILGDQWIDAVCKKEEELGNPAKALVFSFITTFVSAYVLALLIRAIGVTSAGKGAVLALWLGLGLVATSMFSDYQFCGWRTKLFIIQAGCRLACFTAMGAILGAWQ